MAFKKLSKEKVIIGTRILVFGDAGTQKSRFSLTFPKNAYINADQGGDSYYEEFADNISLVSDSLTFSEIVEDIEEIEANLDEIETVTLDSITKVYENQQFSALAIAEARARKAGRNAEAEGLSVKDWGKIKINSEKLSSKLLGLKREGKTIIVIAEGKDETESMVDAQGNSIRKKIGTVANAQKGLEYDFDIVLEMIKDEKTKQTLGAKVHKDRLGVTEEGSVIPNPSYETWAEKIRERASGTKKADKIDFEKSIENDEESFVENKEEFRTDKIDRIKDEITKIINSLTKEKQGELVKAFTKEVGDAKYLSVKEAEKLKKHLEVAKKFK